MSTVHICVLIHDAYSTHGPKVCFQMVTTIRGAEQLHFRLHFTPTTARSQSSEPGAICKMSTKTAALTSIARCHLSLARPASSVVKCLPWVLPLPRGASEPTPHPANEHLMGVAIANYYYGSSSSYDSIMTSSFNSTGALKGSDHARPHQIRNREMERKQPTSY